MPRAPIAAAPAPTPAPPSTRKRSIDWAKYGARSADDGDRTTWRPDRETDSITGTLARVDEAQTRFGAKVLIELDDCTGVTAKGEKLEDGDYLIWPTGGLVNALDDAEADKGDRVTITLIELLDTGKGSPFRRYEAVVNDAAFAE